uniref:Lipocalin/cytosolic fatty-acid binding domain-containing protein n=1 Tax=Graphocephala atropunctata TaxID=36148 RepID=A0A1B6MH93_9HEMI
MRSILLLFVVSATCHGNTIGPCRPVHPVGVDHSKWAGEKYVHLYTGDQGQSCSMVKRQLVDEDNVQFLRETYYRVRNQSGVPVETMLSAKCIEKGHYSVSAELTAGTVTLLDLYFLWYDNVCYAPNKCVFLDIHMICSNSPEFKNGGPGLLFVETQYPDPPKEIASKVKEVLKCNGLSDDLMMIDNCNCTNIPYNSEPSKCDHMTIGQFWGLNQ